MKSHLKEMCVVPEFSPKRKDSGCGESNFSPPMMKWVEK
jgi:hypothetical protein